MESSHGPEQRVEPSVGLARSTSPRRTQIRDEYVLVGGGLQNALIALALLEARPDTRLTLLEREPELGGNHTWCFHAGDVPAAARPWVDRLVVKRWASHDVIFPRHRRRSSDEYNAITSARLHQVVSERLRSSQHGRIVTATVREVGPRTVTTEDGRRFRGRLVIDARGPMHGMDVKPGGYQKFLGLELAIVPGGAPDVPVLMDATVPQLDGFRFMYVLPWAEDRVLIEDTYYSSSDQLDGEALRARVLEYASEHGMSVQGVLREERGVLPIPTRFRSGGAAKSPIRAGYAGGLFHPTTGYSLPVALRFALHMASRPVGAALGEGYVRFMAKLERQQRFCVWLNRLLFDAFAPGERYRVLERFYRLPASTIRRFYALETTTVDRARILCGRPPAGFSLRRLLAGERQT